MEIFLYFIVVFSIYMGIFFALYNYFISGIIHLDKSMRRVVLALLFLIIIILRVFWRYPGVSKFSMIFEVVVFPLIANLFFRNYKIVVTRLINQTILQNLLFYYLRVEDSLISLTLKVRVFLVSLFSFNLTFCCLIHTGDSPSFFYIMVLGGGYINLRNLICDQIYSEKFSEEKSLESFDKSIKVKNFNGEVLFMSLSSSFTLQIGMPLKDKLYCRWKKLNYNELIKQHMHCRATEIFGRPKKKGSKGGSGTSQ